MKLRSGVKKIVVDNGKAVGVVLDDGTELSAKNVLSSAGVVETIRVCPEAASSPSGQQVKYQAGNISFCETIYSLDQFPSEMGHDDTIVFIMMQTNFIMRSQSFLVMFEAGSFVRQIILIMAMGGNWMRAFCESLHLRILIIVESFRGRVSQSKNGVGGKNSRLCKWAYAEN